jgi:hypothetical protein
MIDPLYLAAGKLRHTVSVQQLNRIGDSQWTATDATVATAGWTTLYTTRASIESLGGLNFKEVYADTDLSSVSTHLITMRWNPSFTINAGNQVVSATKTFRVQLSRNVDERNKVWKLLCVEVPA